MTIEIEHKAGTPQKEQQNIETEVKKDYLAKGLGISREELDELIDKAKDFFNYAEKEARKRGTTTLKHDEDAD